MSDERVAPLQINSQQNWPVIRSALGQHRNFAHAQVPRAKEEIQKSGGPIGWEREIRLAIDERETSLLQECIQFFRPMKNIAISAQNHVLVSSNQRRKLRKLTASHVSKK